MLPCMDWCSPKIPSHNAAALGRSTMVVLRTPHCGQNLPPLQILTLGCCALIAPGLLLSIFLPCPQPGLLRGRGVVAVTSVWLGEPFGKVALLRPPRSSYPLILLARERTGGHLHIFFTFFFLFIKSREGKLQTQDLLCSECEQFHTHAFSPKKCPGFGSGAMNPMEPGCRRSLVPSAAARRDGGSVLNPPSQHGSWCCRGKQPSAKRSGSLDSLSLIHI